MTRKEDFLLHLVVLTESRTQYNEVSHVGGERGVWANAQLKVIFQSLNRGGLNCNIMEEEVIPIIIIITL